jgi:stearoyl-CoA desaturase (delta-9 desaturase)
VFIVSAATVLEFHLLSMANTFGHHKHKWSYQNYTGKDHSQNIPWLNWITLGHGLHNNHHGDGASAKFSKKWWEFDIGWMYIIILRWAGLAQLRSQGQ